MTEIAGSGAKILIAEDHPINQKLMIRILELHGFQGEIAENGREAVSRLASEPFDLVLMDMQMPVMDGIEATRRIREQEKESGSRIPIIALTANAFNEDRERCLEAGMDGFLSKPIDNGELLRVLSLHLAGKEKGGESPAP